MLPGDVLDSPLPPHEPKATRATHKNAGDLLLKNGIEVAVRNFEKGCVPPAGNGGWASLAYGETRDVSTQGLSQRGHSHGDLVAVEIEALRKLGERRSAFDCGQGGLCARSCAR